MPVAFSAKHDQILVPSATADKMYQVRSTKRRTKIFSPRGDCNWDTWYIVLCTRYSKTRRPSAGVPPLPIPNREVKPCSADGTGVTPGRVGRRHIIKTLRRDPGGFVFSAKSPRVRRVESRACPGHRDRRHIIKDPQEQSWGFCVLRGRSERRVARYKTQDSRL